jgi:hypothetical protein
VRYQAVCSCLLLLAGPLGMAQAQTSLPSSAPTTGQVLACLNAAADRYAIAPSLLHAMATQESGLNPRAINRSNANGTVDYGLMQINSFWLPTLGRYGITQAHLFDPCINASVGAWILARNFARHGVTWRAVGAYNASSIEKQDLYALRIYQRLLKGSHSPNRMQDRPGLQQPDRPAAPMGALELALGQEDESQGDRQ